MPIESGDKGLHRIDIVPWIIGVCASLIVLAIPFAIYHDYKAGQAFMEACMQDHKEYECVAMKPRSPAATPVFIVR